jgi:acyl-CoA synthetase (AMP-forming)/AMP-acid ligase II
MIVPRDPVRGDAAERVSFRELLERALCAARALRANGGREGERIVIALDNGPDFGFCFFAAIFAGMVPVPFPPQYAVAGTAPYCERLARAVAHCAARFLVCEEDTMVLLRERPALTDRVLSRKVLMAGSGAAALPPAAGTGDLCMIQYTSGTTGRPRGVELSHGNLLYNVHGALEATGGLHEDEVTCGWIPMHHDMGLICTMLKGVYSGVPLVMLTPRTFILRPESWLWAMSRYRAVSSAAPNFAYMLLSRLREDKLAGIDLGAWRLALNGSESVERATTTAFCERFDRYGFHATSMAPGYGLAENTVACCVSDLGLGAKFDAVRRDGLQVRQTAEPTSSADENVVRLVATVGGPIPGQQLRIADAATSALPERAVGEIQVGGICVMMGYHADPEATRLALTSDGFLRTGDRGYIANGKLHVLGRTKDTIKRAGHLYDAAEIRAATREIAEVKGLVASFGVNNPVTGTEDLVVVAESKLNETSEHQRLRQAIAKAIRARMGVQPDTIEIVGPGVIPRTTSGKISNQEARARYLQTARSTAMETGRQH